MRRVRGNRLTAALLGGLASRRTNTIAIVVPVAGLRIDGAGQVLALSLPVLPESAPATRDLVWGARPVWPAVSG